MSNPPSEDVTLCIQRMQAGDDMARNELFEHIYQDLKGLAQRLFRTQKEGQTLQPTALVHEAYLRLVGTQQQTYNDRRHFFSVAALAMRQLITDHARARGAAKRGGDMNRVAFESGAMEASVVNGIDLLALDEALTELAQLNERQCRIVELRFLAGLTIEETAEVVGLAPRTVRLDWTVAKRFLASRLGAD